MGCNCVTQQTILTIKGIILQEVNITSKCAGQKFTSMTAITFDNVSKSFRIGLKTDTVLHDLSLSVQTGEIFGFLGPNGAGKSTSIKLLLNFIRPDKGHILVDDRIVGRDSFQDRIGYLPEMPSFYENLTGMELLRFGGRTHGMAGATIESQGRQILERLNLGHAAHHRIKTYSKGMKQRLGLALALVHDPSIYILDEPMSGLDPMGRRLITDVILELRDKGKTVFFSSHILSDIERMCDRIGILNKGRLLYCGGVDDFAVSNGNSMEDGFVRLISRDNEAAQR